MKYQVNRLKLIITQAQDRLKQFLNSLKLDVVAFFPKVEPVPFTLGCMFDFLLIVKKGD